MPKKKGRARNYAIPVPAWWLLAIGKIRDERTDADMLADIETQTGHRYSRPVLSRYCSGEITTLELTEDIWRTYRARYRLSRPFIIAASSDDAARIERSIASSLEGEVEAIAKYAADSEQTDRVGSARGEDERTGGTMGPRRGRASSRRS